jgi:hypothetical protein
MNCPSCQTANPAAAKFCMNCGSLLANRCPNCQTELPAGAKFCFNCGQPASPAAPTSPTSATPTEVGAVTTAAHLAGERRMVTVMFADISGFTALSEKMDPEQVRNLMNGCFDQLVLLCRGSHPYAH